MLVRPITRPLVSALGDPLRENALPWDEGVRGGRTGSSWSPLLLTNLRGWYRADLGTLDGGGSPTASGEVQTWQDQSGNGNHLAAASSGVRPSVSSSDAAFSNRAVMVFGGVDEYLIRTTFDWGAATPLAGSTLFYVVRLLTNSSGFVVMSYSGTPGYWITQTTTSRFVTRVISATHTPATNFNTTARSVMTTYDGANFQTYVGGTSVAGPTAQTGGATDDQYFVVGASNTGTFPTHMAIAEIALMRSVATAGEKASWDAYVTARYGV